MIDTNYGIPGGVNTIEGIINQYGTPEAADSDMFFNAPRGREYMIDQYQALTGNSFLSDHGDPFEEASRARAAALTTAAVQPNRPIISTGSNMGVHAIQSPIDPNLSVAYAHARGEATSPMEAEAARMGGGQSNLSAAWSHPEANLDAVQDPNSPDFLRAQKTRVSSLGSEAMSLFDTLRSNTPAALTPTSRISPKLQKDEKGKVVAGDVLNSDLFSHPAFQKMIKEKPEKAKQFYAAVTGRDLDQDVSMQVASNTKRQTERDRVLANLADKLDFDDVTGKPYIREYVAGLMPGERKEVKRPLSYVEQQMMDQEGGFKSRFGFPPPAGMDVGKGATPKAQMVLRAHTADFMEKHPGVPKEIALMHVKQELQKQMPDLMPAPKPTAGSKEERIAALSAISHSGRPTSGLMKFLAGAENVSRGAMNVPINAMSDLLTGNRYMDDRLPTIPFTSENEVANQFASMPSPSDVIAQIGSY